MKKAAFYLVTLLISFLFLISVNTNNVVKGLYYGQSTSVFPQSGYIFIDLGNNNFGQCGINYVSDTVGVTAAHCLEGGVDVFAGVGTYREDFFKSSPKVTRIDYSPKYNETTFSFNPGLGDVGVVIFSSEVDVNEHAFIDSPQIGCNYYLVGYGRNQNGSTYNRTGTDVCIKNISEHSFELTFAGNSHFCNGDSGSGVYEKGTNNIVGVVSAFYTQIGDTNCENGLAYVVARLDINLDYLSNFIPESAYKDGPTVEETVPNDYFGELYPETKNEDGSFNYENELILKIEDLSQQFKDIFPEGGSKTPTPSVTTTIEITPTPDDQVYIDYQGTDSSGLILIMCMCFCLISGGVIILGLFFVFMRKRKAQVTKV